MLTKVKIISLFTFVLIVLFDAAQTFAQTDCASLRDTQGTQGPASRFNGNTCNIPGQYNKNKSCIGSAGGRYTVYYCNPNGCEEEYPEAGPNPPALCDRPDAGAPSAIRDVFGQILPPQAIQNFGFGGLGISTFLSNLIALIYAIAIIVLIFMIIWGAWDWLTSEGDKEKLQNAQRKIINAIIGIILFAVAFAIIQVLGQFTGFKFF